MALEPREAFTKDVLELGRLASTYYSKDEWENIILKLQQDWLWEVGGAEDGRQSVFNLLQHFTCQVLGEDVGSPIVRDEHLLRWRELSSQVGEDLLTCAHFGFCDHRSNTTRSFYAWRPIITSDNVAMRKMLEKGMAENHFHLNGSATIFSISWLVLMNQIGEHEVQVGFDELLSTAKQTPTYINGNEEVSSDLRRQVRFASYIRKELFQVLMNPSESDVRLGLLRQLIDSDDTRTYLQDIQGDISLLKRKYGRRFSHKGNEVVPDYALPQYLHDANMEANVYLCGERKLLIDCFRAVYSKASDFLPWQPYFYYYLLVKSKLRQELIQVNRKVGFANFSDYQDRKDIFIEEGSIYEVAFLHSAVNDTVANQAVHPFETRISSKDSAVKQHKSVRRYDDVLMLRPFDSIVENDRIDNAIARLGNRSPRPRSTDNWNHFYVLHFIKKKDPTLVKFARNKNGDRPKAALHMMASIEPRHDNLRRKVKDSAQALTTLREHLFYSADRILGIDAAANETHARAEVFAQAFRYLKEHKLSGERDHLRSTIDGHKLRATFHAGEDFLDLTDGLRAIDEAILFLNLKNGDRLGHALAIGVIPKEYYEYKKYKLALPKQDVLDNIVWLLAKRKQYGIDDFGCQVSELEGMYTQLFSEIYQRNFDGQEANKHYPHETYYEAWKLRGDDPHMYFKHREVSRDLKGQAITYWQRCGKNEEFPKGNGQRHNADANFLYHSYHFNAMAKNEGTKIKQFIVTPTYIKLVAEVQERMLKEFAKLNIAIECNPSSNYLIGTFRRYAKHPISRLFNLGLVSDHNQIQDCPQIRVSINTDDQGVFATSLENEYALMAKAMEKELDEDGNPIYKSAMIYQWLDHIRQMGIEMSFG